MTVTRRQQISVFDLSNAVTELQAANSNIQVQHAMEASNLRAQQAQEASLIRAEATTENNALRVQ